MHDVEQRIRALPVWRGAITWQRLEGGLSNESFVVDCAGERYVVRFGRDFPFHHVSREREVMVARAAHVAGFAPELVHSDPGVMVSRFIDGRTLDAADVRREIPRIARTVRAFHDTMGRHVSGPGYMFWVFHVIRDYARRLRAEGSMYREHLDEWLSLAAELEAAQAPLPIVFGHHDLLPANFIDDGERLWIIDFEYAGFSTAMFDLAGIASNAEFDAGEARTLLAAYFGAAPTAAILRSHAAMQCASLLREAMWSMVSELHLETPGVDFRAYTRENLERLQRALEAYRNGRFED